jgi:DNA polymerase-3 subunit beta
MNFICLKKDLEKKIKFAELFLGKNLEHPILLGVLLKVENNLLTIISTNIESEFKAIIPVKKIEDGEVVVSGEVLNKIISNSKSEEIEFLKEGNILKINQKGSYAKINLLEKEDFPEIKELNEDVKDKFSLKADIVKRGIESVYFASKDKNMKPELSSIFFDFSKAGEMIMAATDGYRLAESKTILESEIQLEENNKKILIPRSFIINFLKILESKNDEVVTFNILDNNQMIFEIDSCYIKTRVTEGQFPQYEKLIPVDREVSVIMLKQDILEAFKMLNVFSDKSDQVFIDIESGIMKMRSKNDFGDNLTEIEAVVDGKNIDMKFNLKNIAEVITSINSDSFEFIFNENKPLLIKKVGDKNYNYIVMPLRK